MGDGKLDPATSVKPTMRASNFEFSDTHAATLQLLKQLWERCSELVVVMPRSTQKHPTEKAMLDLDSTALLRKLDIVPVWTAASTNVSAVRTSPATSVNEKLVLRETAAIPVIGIMMETGLKKSPTLNLCCALALECKCGAGSVSNKGANNTLQPAASNDRAAWPPCHLLHQ